jgi:hypothetical protein
MAALNGSNRGYSETQRYNHSDPTGLNRPFARGGCQPSKEQSNVAGGDPIMGSLLSRLVLRTTEFVIDVLIDSFIDHRDNGEDNTSRVRVRRWLRRHRELLRLTIMVSIATIELLLAILIG